MGTFNCNGLNEEQEQVIKLALETAQKLKEVGMETEAKILMKKVYDKVNSLLIINL